MARLCSTSVSAVLLLLVSNSGWTAGKTELRQTFSGLAQAAESNPGNQFGGAFLNGASAIAKGLAGNAATDNIPSSTSAGATDIIKDDLGPDVLPTPPENNNVANKASLGGLVGGPGTSLGDGLSWNFGSKGMIQMLTGFFMTFMSGSANPNSALNVYGSALMSQDPVEISAAFGKLLTSLDMSCAFQMTSGGDGVDMKFRDGKEALHIQFVPTTKATVFNFKGEFPKSRAFSYATYAVANQQVSFVDMISDVDMVASTGSNPFTAGPGNTGASGSYDLYVTPDGKQGFPNEIKTFADGDVTNELSGIIIVYRVIMADGIKSDGWGGVPPPALRVKAFSVLATGLWFNLAPCNPKNDITIENFIENRLALKEGMSDVKVECDVFNMDNNFVYYDDAQYFKTPDENHIISCGNRALLPPGADMITIISGTLPPASDSRYASISLVNLYPPGRNVYSVSDQSLRNFYWDQGKSAVNYTIIMAKNKLALNKCGLSKLPANWYQVYWAGFADALEGSYPGIVYREMMTDGYEQSLEQVRYACEAEKDCSNPKFFEQQMGDYYPRISYLSCSSSGLAPAPIKNENLTFPEPRLPRPAFQGLWTSLAGNDLLGVESIPQASVTMAALQGSDVYVNGKLAGRATDNVKVVSKQTASFGWSPIQSVYYDPENPVTANPVIREYMDADGNPVQLELVPTPAKFLPDEVLFAVKVPITGGLKAFFATHDVCGTSRSSAAGWKCIATTFPDANWTLPSFDDSKWLPAKALKKGEACSGMPTDCTALPPDAQGIWADTCTGSGGPNQGNVYCRLRVPQTCDLTARAGSDDRVKTWCPDLANAVATARFASPTLHWLYANGLEVGGDQTMVIPAGTTSFALDPAAPTVVLAFKAVDDTRKVVKSFIKGQFNLCGFEHVTDASWRCAPSEPFTDDWLQPGFDDSEWDPVRVVDGFPWQPNPSAGMSPESSWVWAQSGIQTFCRLEVPNPVYGAKQFFEIA
ncbi:hypothetical protein NGA_0332100 [Nannochloropsis gaditana CCMP526]|uniref:Uncharacterized protein n=1 Tax=Nannochloropsis gaditana TaxID=72520 RepID=W7TZK1_9STRA|nr:hypothetical protein NGA_0332100 [Nannochloropsis gaditana CCMP526]EKU20237.1 hypothetical protein NGA_0332100 [Nannochloropsis gaditana CCMP526]EWM25879.1 hypothetical protein Naga_100054g15 [Nannochloropsis gaditana]|eukprot:XP_005856101.1 hypothetical protein NGA_0332100 [Nannochloropsis gaditana CCMP526]